MWYDLPTVLAWSYLDTEPQTKLCNQEVHLGSKQECGTRECEVGEEGKAHSYDQIQNLTKSEGTEYWGSYHQPT